jgi:Flp pilus assembly secretin CpaC
MPTASKFRATKGAVRALAVGLALALNAGVAKATEDLVVKYDQSELVHLPRPAAQIIVGNPSIADISVKSDKLLVVTGKTFGITNIIILDAQSNIISNQRVLVRRDEAKVVNLQRGVNRQSYNCTPQCNPSITVGDETGYFDSISKASQNKIGFSERSAEPGANAGPGATPNQ